MNKFLLKIICAVIYYIILEFVFKKNNVSFHHVCIDILDGITFVYLPVIFKSVSVKRSADGKPKKASSEEIKQSFILQVLVMKKYKTLIMNIRYCTSEKYRHEFDTLLRGREHIAKRRAN